MRKDYRNENGKIAEINQNPLSEFPEYGMMYKTKTGNGRKNMFADAFEKRENGIFVLPHLDFGGGKRGIRLRFAGMGGCMKIRLALDSPDRPFAVLMAVNVHGFPEKNEVFTEFEPVTGVHDLYFIPDGSIQLLSADISETSPYEDISYEPVPDSVILDNGHDTWSAEDELGRRVKDPEDVKGRRHDRHVGIFYWSWRDWHAHYEPVSVTDVLKQYPGAEYNDRHPVWKNAQAFWNEPLYGYYLNRDPYIIRRHAVLLANAGVDMIMFDCTNGSLVWKESYEPIFEGFRQARLDGINAPKIAFMLNFGPASTTEDMLRALYQDLYKPGRYRDLWFMLDGKPFIMAYPEALPEKGCCDADTALLCEIRRFFTFRRGQPSYGFGPTQTDMWGWLEKYPQHKFGERADGTSEMMTVGVAQNCNDEMLCTYFNNKGTYGRSYTKEYGHRLLDETSYKYGYNVQEQWNRAIDCDPEFIFVTGWNEWLMGRWHQPWVKDPDNPQLAFVDQFDLEHSRDIEPDRNGIRDSYYLQLCSNIRRYKGAARLPAVSEPKTIRTMEDWDDVKPLYRSEKGTAADRDCPGFGSTYYVNKTGRNNIIAAKTARDGENVYFMAECAEEITEPAENWMTLLVNRNRSRETGWEGYDIAVRYLSGDAADIRFYENGEWQTRAEAYVRREGKRMMYVLPRSIFGEGPLDFEFKWADNISLTDAMDFYVDGDTAPFGRFNYRYCEKRFPVRG